MERRLGVQSLSALAAVIALSASAACSSGGARPQRAVRDKPPNVLVIITDDQRYDQMETLVETRRIFGEKGTRYTNAFASTPRCCPSRASIFSGQYAHNHNVKTNDDALALNQDATIQRYLGEAGYRTAIVGKYLNKWPKRRRPRHFDDWSILVDGHYYDPLFNEEGKLRRTDYSSNYMQRKSLELLEDFEARDDQPWLLYITPDAPHWPHTPERKYADAKLKRWKGNPAVRERDRSDKPSFFEDKRLPANWTQRVHLLQRRTLFSVDELVDAVFRKLSALDEARDTLAFFMSDNGYALGEHGLMNKRLPYTESIKLVFYARWPGELDAGELDRRLVGNLDVPATVLDAAGVLPDVRNVVDGRSLLEDRARDRFLLEHWNDGLPITNDPESDVPAWASLRTTDYQYTEYYDDDGKIEFREYYDLREDPWQLVNLLDDGDPTNDPDTTALAAQLKVDRSCKGPACP